MFTALYVQLKTTRIGLFAELVRLNETVCSKFFQSSLDSAVQTIQLKNYTHDLIDLIGIVFCLLLCYYIMLYIITILKYYYYIVLLFR